MAIEKSVPAGLTIRAKTFIQSHGYWTGCRDFEQYRVRWMEHGVPAAQVDRVVAFEAVWGGLALPPSPHYDGGGRGRSAGMYPRGRILTGASKPACSVRLFPTRS